MADNAQTADDELTPAASRALDTLFDANGPVVVETCAATVKSILQHILDADAAAERDGADAALASAKYRRLRFESRALREKVLPAKGADELLFALGFRRRVEDACPPAARATLAQMGFDDEAARHGLARAANDVARAAEWLARHRNDPDVVGARAPRDDAAFLVLEVWGGLLARSLSRG